MANYSGLTIPNHVGIILDGNRRWAKQHGLPAYEGHLAGYNTLKEVGLELLKAGVAYLSVYAFSTENWQRDEEEVSKLMGLTMRAFQSDLGEFNEKNIKLRVLGNFDRVDAKIKKAIKKAESETSKNTGGTLAVCFSYGGQQEIVDAANKLRESKKAISIASFEKELYAPDVPPIDMLVRTGGEQRLSNFMLWRAAYAELMFVKKFWPDMTKADVTAIMREYSRRQRRFGG